MTQPLTQGQPRPAGRDDLWTAALDVFEASQQLILDQLTLLRADLRGDAGNLILVFAWLFPVTVFGTVGVLVLGAAATLMLARVQPIELALLEIGGVLMVMSLALTIFAIRRYRAFQLGPEAMVRREFVDG